MGRRVKLVAVFVFMVVAALASAGRAEGPLPIGTVETVVGTVQVGRDGVWQLAAAKTRLFDGQLLRTAAGSGVEVLFDGGVSAKLGENSEIAAADLQLKAQLEKAKAKISVPVDATKAEMQVTPLTGVRGTEKTEEKAGELKREHYWNENPPAAK